MSLLEVDILIWTLWDTLRISKDTSIKENTVFTLFNEPLGFNKSKLETNLYISELLPQPQHFNCCRTRPMFAALNNKTDNHQFMDNVSYIFWIGDKIYDDGLMIQYQYWDGTTDLKELLEEVIKAKEMDYNICGGFKDYRIGADPIGHHILMNQRFSVTLVIHNKITFKEDFKLTWGLEGMLSRGVC